jgi:chromate transport protein ChrA
LLDFLSTMRAAGMATGAKKPSRLIRATILLLVFPGQAAAHDFALGGDAYAKFLSGCAAVLTELPVMIAMIATGILVSLWDREGLPKVWLAFVAGVVGGILFATAALIEPSTVAYGSAIALGLLAAAAVTPDVKLMRLVLFFAGFLPVSGTSVRSRFRNGASGRICRHPVHVECRSVGICRTGVDNVEKHTFQLGFDCVQGVGFVVGCNCAD